VPATARLSDLVRAVNEQGEVIAVEELGGGLVELTATLPGIASRARGGDFAQLRCGPGPVPLLRRPMSVAHVEGESCGFVFERVGQGTALLGAMQPGDRIDALGPLGVGFTMPGGPGRVLCVAGGLGCAPFPLAAAQALRAGSSEVIVLHGAAIAARLYPAERFSRGDSRVTVVEATEDGSRGHPGLITELVGEHVAAGVDAIWACGPNAMLSALAATLEGCAPLPAIVEASLEAPMGCGFGTCLGCALPVLRDGGGWALCCREGPVMDMGAVDWAGLRQLPPAHVA
jgi:dihydroorotate dehydrogenase electron transfer subunit